MQLAALDTAQTVDDLKVPGFALHSLKGDMRGRWAINS
jgi:toxin HigB-1